MKFVLYNLLGFFCCLVSSIQTASPSLTPTTIPSSIRSSANNIYTLSGLGTESSTGSGGLASAANLGRPITVWKDSGGTISVLEYTTNCIRQFAYSSGIINNYAGVCSTSTGSSGDNGAATSALFNSPFTLAVNTQSEMYIADRYNNKVRKVSSSVITTFMGTGDGTDNGNGGTVTTATINQPVGLWVDSIGSVYVTSSSNFVRQISSSLIVTLRMGTGAATFSGDDGQATAATVNFPERIFITTAGVIYVSDLNNFQVRQISTSNIVTTIIGTGSTAYSGENIPATSCNLYNPTGVVADTSNGDIYVSSYLNGRILVMTKATSLVTTYVGSNSISFSGDGGAATSSALSGPGGLYLDDVNRLIISDCNNYRVRVVYSVLPTMQPSIKPTPSPSTNLPTRVRSSANNIYTLSGLGTDSSDGTGGLASAASLGKPLAIWKDSLGVISVVESTSNCVRQFSYPNDIIANFVGDCITSGSSGDNGPASSSLLNSPCAFTINSVGTIYISDNGNNKIRKVSNSIITVFMGTGLAADNGNGAPATAANVNSPRGIWTDTTGVLYVATGGNFIRQVATNLVASVKAGIGSSSYSGDSGKATSAALNAPDRIFMVTTGILYISDTGNKRIRQINFNIITTIIGTGTGTYNGENVKGTSCNLNVNSGVVGETLNGDIYVATYAGSRVQVMTKSSSLVTTFVGSGTGGYSGDDGAASSAQINSPTGLYLDESDRLLICDTLNYRVRVVYSVDPTMQPTAPTVVPTLQPTAPTVVPTIAPSVIPTIQPTAEPSVFPTIRPSDLPTVVPSAAPSFTPTVYPSVEPTVLPSTQPTVEPSTQPSFIPTVIPTICPTAKPTIAPSIAPSFEPTIVPTVQPSASPSVKPTLFPTVIPTMSPTDTPTVKPSDQPTEAPTLLPTVIPSFTPTAHPSVEPTVSPTIAPSTYPTDSPTTKPSIFPSVIPTTAPTVDPTQVPTVVPTKQPTIQPTDSPSLVPTIVPSKQPSIKPSTAPSIQPTEIPSIQPTVYPSVLTVCPSIEPSNQPTQRPSTQPSIVPMVAPTVAPTIAPTVVPTKIPSINPSAYPSIKPSESPSAVPSVIPSVEPSHSPSVKPTIASTCQPSAVPTQLPTVNPTIQPTERPSHSPTLQPSIAPSVCPTVSLSINPSLLPSQSPTQQPSVVPSLSPTLRPSLRPTLLPTLYPTSSLPSVCPTSCSPTATPSTLEYYESHPKATLPNNNSISVIGSQSTSFKIVLPFFALSSGSNGVAFSDIELTSGSMGTAYVLYGNASMPSVVGADSVLVTSHSNFIALDSAKRSVVVIPDVNGDSYDDLIIGDPYAAKCYVLYGTVDGLVNMNKGFTIFGESEGDLTGWSVNGAGDVNNDTIADIIIGAPSARKVGALYVIYGRSSSSFDVYLNNLTYTSGFAMYGASKSDYLGISVCGAGDVNRDGCDDIIVGAVMTSLFYAGAIYIVFGGAVSSGTVSSLQSRQGFRITGSSYSYVGCSVSGAGDVNDDGYDDVLIGSNPQRSNMVPAAYLIYGSASESSGNIMLSSLTAQQGIRISGSGMIVSYVGDVNGDKYDDIFIGGGIVNNGLIVYSDSTHLTKTTSKPSTAPSLTPFQVATGSPSKKPSCSPSLSPSKLPSVLPTLSPTSPTVTPTEGATAPTSHPSARPSCPTLQPSFEPSGTPTINPTLEPTNIPSHCPTENPSYLPSVSPTELPSQSTSEPSTLEPTQLLLTRPPFSTPTILPTIIPVYTVSYVSSGANVNNQSEGYQHYIVNSSETVSISNVMGFNKYSVVPNANSLIVIVYFNKSNDIIDLTYFPMYDSFQSLVISVISEGSVIISLPQEQTIRILNLHPTDVDANNFLFFEFIGTLPHYSKNAAKISIYVGALIVVGAIVFVFLCGFRLYGHRVQYLLSKRAVVKNVYLMEINTVDGKLIENNDDLNTDDDSYFNISDISHESEEYEENSVQFSNISMDTDIQEFEDAFNINRNNYYDVDDNSSALLSEYTLDSGGEFIDRETSV